MLSLLLFHLFTTAACFNAGFAGYSFLWQFGTEVDLEKKNPVVVLFSGLVVLTLIGQVIALFYPVNIFTSVGLFFLFQLLAFAKRKSYYGYLKKVAAGTRNLHPVFKAGFLCTWALLLLLNAGPTLMDDTESYHIQMVKWIQEYGTVPGIANLHERYGFNSSWFTSVALFSLPFHFNYYAVLNGTVSIWLALYLWLRAAAAFKAVSTVQERQSGWTSLLLLCVSIFFWPLLRGNVSTANYDFITSAMLVVLFYEVYFNNTGNKEQNPEILLWPVYLFTVRIMNFPLLLLTTFAIIRALRANRIRFIYTVITAALLLVLPFFVRNVILSGYLFYPSPYFDLFQVDWKVDPKVIDDLLYYIKYYNRVNAMYQPLDVTAALPFPQWIRPWYQYLFFYDKPILVMGLAGFLSYFTFGKIHLFNRTAVILVLTMLFQLALWFVVAPDPRFVYGPLLCGTMLLFYTITAMAKNNFFRMPSFAVTGFLLFFTLWLFLSKLRHDKRYQNFLISYKLPQPPVHTVTLGSIELYLPDKIMGNWNARCYATPLPCLYKRDSRLHLRGTTIKQGFSIQ